MQRGTWSFDDHTTSTWVPSESLGIPGPQHSTEPVRDESAVWDDPDEATRKLSAHDLARTVDSATDLNMDWDEDESTTCTYNPSQMAEAVGLPTIPSDLDTPDVSSRQSIIQASPRARMKTDPQLNAGTPRVRTRSGTIPRSMPDEAAQPQRPQTSQSGMRTRAVHPGEPGTRPYDFKRDDLAQVEDLEWQKARARADHEIQLQQYEEERAWHEAQVQAQQVAALEEQRAWLEAQARAERASNPRGRQEERARRETQARAAERARDEERAWREARAHAEHEAQEERAWHEAQARAERAAAAEAARREQEQEHARRTAQARAERVALERAREEERAWREARAQAERAAAAQGRERRSAHTQADRAAAAERAQQQQLAQARVLREAQAHEERVAAAKAAERARAEEREWRSAMARAQQHTAPQSFAAAVPQPAYQPQVAEEDSLVGELTPARPRPLQLALRSVLPGTGLLGALLAARVLLAGPPPLPAPPPSVLEAPPAPAPAPAPASVAPIVEDVPAAAPKIEPAQTRKERSSGTSDGARATRRSSRSSASSTPSSSSAPAEPRERPSRTHEVAASAEPPVERAPSHASQPSAASGIGLLRLNSRPWSQVFVDGKPMGNTPQMGLRLSAGSHQIELINREMGMSKKFQVKIVADEVVTRIETLTE